jgi:hypothetical protein
MPPSQGIAGVICYHVYNTIVDFEEP